jgi:hypothetical protein
MGRPSASAIDYDPNAAPPLPPPRSGPEQYGRKQPKSKLPKMATKAFQGE